jgi:ABC-2 type transport system ATP-binding protein
MPVSPMVEAAGIRKRYGSHQVLDGVDLDIASGEVYALLGPNGAGKTTLIKILATLLPPDAGTARVAGYDVVRQGRSVRQLTSLTLQDAAVDELLTGEENLLLFGRLRRLGRAERRRRAAELLAQLDLETAARRPVKTYSGGMRRRLDLAIGMITRPRMIFLDEPTTGLDPRSRQVTWDIVRSLAADGTTILLTTQYLEEADRLAGRVGVLHEGRIVVEGPPEELKGRVAGEQVELTFAGPADLDRAAAVLGSFVTAPPVGTLAAADLSPPRLVVPTDGRPEQLHAMLDALARHHVPVERLALRRPTLDEVFLGLTANGAS